MYVFSVSLLRKIYPLFFSCDVLSQAGEHTDVHLLICHQNFKLIKTFLKHCIILTTCYILISKVQLNCFQRSNLRALISSSGVKFSGCILLQWYNSMFIIPQASEVSLSRAFVYCLWQWEDFPVPQAIMLSGVLPETQPRFNLLYAKLFYAPAHGRGLESDDL